MQGVKVMLMLAVVPGNSIHWQLGHGKEMNQGQGLPRGVNRSKWSQTQG